ncbi:hypothetical protein SOVF_193690 [Spinacia oleracea]|nr:hypothetical protein SOVF_193690 [Spinacia oleracea]
MWFDGGKKISVIMTVGIVILIVFMLVCQSVRAIRSFPDKNLNAKNNNGKEDDDDDDDLFAKYFKFNATALQFNRGSSSALDDIKRKVPSCPDPLHNK